MPRGCPAGWVRPSGMGVPGCCPPVPGSPSWLCVRLPGEGSKANDSLSRPLVTSARHMIPCRTGATCCHSGPVQCCFCPALNRRCHPRKWSPPSSRCGLVAAPAPGPRDLTKESLSCTPQGHTGPPGTKEIARKRSMWTVKQRFPHMPHTHMIPVDIPVCAHVGSDA